MHELKLIYWTSSRFGYIVSWCAWKLMQNAFSTGRICSREANLSPSPLLTWWAMVTKDKATARAKFASLVVSCTSSDFLSHQKVTYCNCSCCTPWRQPDCTVMFPSVSKISFPILSVWRCVHTETFSRYANTYLDKKSISCGLLSPFILHQIKSLLVNEFLKMSSAHYNKVNSFIWMFSITDTKSVASSRAKHIL